MSKKHSFFCVKADFPSDVYEGKSPKAIIPYQIQFNAKMPNGMKAK